MDTRPDVLPARPHTVHCGPDSIDVSALGAGTGDGGPGGIAVLDHTTFEVRGPWEADRGDLGLKPARRRVRRHKIIDIPAEPASSLPPALQPLGAVPPLVTHIDLSVDDRYLLVAAGALTIVLTA